MLDCGVATDLKEVRIPKVSGTRKAGSWK